jgi:hypothetical protein
MWLHKLLTDLLDHEMDPMMITKEPCVKLLEIPVFPDGMKYLRMIQKKDCILAVPFYT